MPVSNAESVNAIQTAGLDVIFGLARKGFDAWQRLATLNLQTVRASIEAGEAQARKALAAKDPQDWFALQTSAFEPAADRLREYMRETYEITAGARGEIEKVMEAQYASGKEALERLFESASQGAPAGSEGAWNAWQSALASTATFCETMQQTTRQAVEQAESHIASAVAASVPHKADVQAARAAKR